MQWLGAGRHQAIARISVDPDLCRHISSVGYNKFKAEMIMYFSAAG